MIILSNDAFRGNLMWMDFRRQAIDCVHYNKQLSAWYINEKSRYRMMDFNLRTCNSNGGETGGTVYRRHFLPPTFISPPIVILYDITETEVETAVQEMKNWRTTDTESGPRTKYLLSFSNPSEQSELFFKVFCSTKSKIRKSFQEQRMLREMHKPQID